MKSQYYRYLTNTFFLFLLTIYSASSQQDFTKAKLFSTVSDPAKLLRSKTVLLEEIHSRTGIKMTESPSLGKEKYVILALEEDLSRLPHETRTQYESLPGINAEGFKIFTDRVNGHYVIVGKDPRGLLYGIGRFLRKVELSPGRILIPDDLVVATSPHYSLRGHQLGYRPKTNSYDAFTVQQYDQYIRELALFGANSIEIMPPRTDDAFTSIHMKIPAIEMIKEKSRICDSYGLDVWMWYPNLSKDYRNPENIKKELAEREEVFRTVSRLDALFAPGGDPGDLEPDELFEWMGKVAKVLNKYHPNAKIWISPQSFRPDKAWFDSFFNHVNQNYPWLGGIVFGPWVKIPIEEIRARVNSAIPIRNYPDITHSLACQYPVPDWDMAWAITAGREAVNPRPVDQKRFHNAVAPYCVGSISYSEGTNDDVNKFIWSDQDWNPNSSVRETLEDYARLFFGPEYAHQGAHAIALLEKNHLGPLLSNLYIEKTLVHWQDMERQAEPQLLRNPRFQMGLIRAYYDALIRERLIYETNLENRAKELLRNASSTRLNETIQESIEILEKTWKEPIRLDLIKKCEDLADSLFASIGAQLTIEKHGAMSGRGNFIDFLRYPLNDAAWLISELKKISDITDQTSQLAAVHKLLHRTNPGPGGFYDHLASPESRHRIVSTVSWEEDPGSLRSPRTGFGLSLPDQSWYTEIEGVAKRVPMVPRTWNNQIETLYDTPLKVRYENLEKDASYRIRVVYTGRFKSNLKLIGDDQYLIHDYIKVGQHPVYEFDVPREVTQDGIAEFTWTCQEAERGIQVAEIWLIKKSDSN